MGKIQTERRASSSSFLLQPSPPRTSKLRSNNLSVRDTCFWALLAFFALLLFLCSLGFLHWPTNPEVRIIDIELNHANVSESTAGAFGSPVVSMDLEIHVRNRDFVAREYDSILLLLQYEGRWEGNTTTEGVAVGARSNSSLQLNAQIHLSRLVTGDGGGVAKGFTSVGIVVHVGGNFQFLYFDVVVRGSTSCAITVDPEQQTLTCQECCTKNP